MAARRDTADAAAADPAPSVTSDTVTDPADPASDAPSEGGRPKIASTAPILIELVSYGKTHGKPAGPWDEVYNCESIPNPSSSSRKGRTGLDKRLRTEVMACDAAQTMVDRATAAVLAAVDRCRSEPTKGESTHVVRFGFGCAMGKHRSVSVVETLAAALTTHLRDADNVVLEVTHRDVSADSGGNSAGSGKGGRHRGKGRGGKGDRSMKEATW